jgi:secreted PhoX family phosphatase
VSLLTGLNGTTVNTIYEFGLPVNGTYLSGVPDGLGAYRASNGNIRLLVNSELSPDKGFGYSLANGTQLTGGRLNFLEIHDEKVVSGGLAFDTIYDRRGRVVTNGSQINGGTDGILGFNRFCSANFIQADSFGANKGFKDDLFLIGEESGNVATMQVFDPKTKSLHAAPDLGYGGWESATVLDTGSKKKVAILLGDDNSSAPIYLYVGKKKENSSDLLKRNGLAGGQMYVWCANTGATTSSSLAEGSTTDGVWKKIATRDAAKAGESGYDARGYKYATTLRAEAKAMDAFIGYRIEDVDHNPNKPNQAAFNTTGGETTPPYPAVGAGTVGSGDYYGSTWTIETRFEKGTPITGKLKHVYDGDAANHRQNGIRSQDNLAWSGDGNIYICEDRSTEAGADGGVSDWGSEEGSIWQLDPVTGGTSRVAQINRSGSLPSDVTDAKAGTIGLWETSGIIDVSPLYGHVAGTDFFVTVQAHGTIGGTITSQNLAEGGSIEHLVFG